MTREYCVRLIDLPPGVHGCVSEDADGFFSVYVNARDSRERQYMALDHERRHIENNDFAKSDVVEAEEWHEKN